MKFKSDQEALVLATLVVGPQHGYGIIKRLREGSNGLFEMNEGQLYPLLHKMQEKGWIVGQWETSESGPARKTYSLLEAGQKELEARKSQWSSFTDAVNGLMTSEDSRDKKSPLALPILKPLAVEVNHG